MILVLLIHFNTAVCQLNQLYTQRRFITCDGQRLCTKSFRYTRTPIINDLASPSDLTSFTEVATNITPTYGIQLHILDKR